MFASRTNWRLDTNRFTRALEEHRRSGRELLDLTVSNPTECGFDYPEKEILAALADPRSRISPGEQGLRETREAATAYYEGRSRFGGPRKAVDPEHVLLTSGTSEAYSHIFRLLCEAGNEILIPAPSYPLFEFLADLADIRLVPYPLLYDHGWQIDFVSLRAAITPRSRALLVVHPNNPTGSFVKPGEAAELASICSAREMAIVADEVFLDYANEMDAARTFAFQDSALTFTLSGLSKISLLPQMKLAWMVVSGSGRRWFRPQWSALKSSRTPIFSPSTRVQLALPKFLSRCGTVIQAHRCSKESPRIFQCSGCSACANRKFINRLERKGAGMRFCECPVTGTDRRHSP